MRTGKIARLPREIRDQLNRRLLDGEPGRQLVDWLNALPEVQAALQRDFDGRPINEPNMTDRKQGGYRDWLTQQDALSQAGELAANAGELAEISQGSMADHLATVLTARYAGILSALNGGDGEGADELRRKLRDLREFCHDLVALRRGDHKAERLKLERTRMEECREKRDEDIFEYFLRWIEYPKVRDCICADAPSPQARRTRLRELLGLEPEEQSNTPEAAEN